MAKPIAIHLVGTGEVVGELRSLETAHQIAHRFLGEWPDLSPLAVTDREHGGEWRITAGECSPLTCDVAVDLAEAAEARTDHTRREPTSGEQAHAPFGPSPLPQPPAPARPAATAGGLPIRVPTALPAQPAATTIDPALLERVLHRLRRL